MLQNQHSVLFQSMMYFFSLGINIHVLLSMAYMVIKGDISLKYVI